MVERKYSGFNFAGLVLGPVVFVALLLAPTPEGMSPEGHKAAAVAALMAVWWISEAIPLAATALLPIALFPLLGVIPGTQITRAYGDANIFLFAGGFFIAMAMQKWNLHERIALNIVFRTGGNLSRLTLGFMIATAFLSLWISNTATTLMMLPIALAVITHVERAAGEDAAESFAVCLLLGIAYASSIGGVGTLIGTPPNIVLAAQYTTLHPDAQPIGFVQWMFVGVPFVVIFLPIVWLLCTKVLFPVGHLPAAGAREQIAARLDELGRMSRGEKTVLVVGICTALGWMFRADIELGGITVPGWSNLFPHPSAIHDSTVAIFFATLLFVIPVNLRRGEFALDWEWAKRIPWGVLVLFGGGLAIAQAFETTGLVTWLGERLEVLRGLPPILIIAAIALMLTFLTEMTSNTATTTIMMPILGGSAAAAMGVHPLLLMIPAAISASCAFMLPVATPPNAIVFGSGHLTVARMAKAGIWINLIGVVLVSCITYFIAHPVFGLGGTQE